MFTDLPLTYCLPTHRHSWDLPLYQSPWDVPEAPQLPLLAGEIFDDLGLTSYFEIRPATFANFIREVPAVPTIVPTYKYTV